MRVVVVKAFGQWCIGDVIPEMPGGQARTLMARGLVREETAPPAKGLFGAADRMLRKGRVVNRAQGG